MEIMREEASIKKIITFLTLFIGCFFMLLIFKPTDALAANNTYYYENISIRDDGKIVGDLHSMVSGGGSGNSYTTSANHLGGSVSLSHDFGTVTYSSSKSTVTASGSKHGTGCDISWTYKCSVSSVGTHTGSVTITVSYNTSPTSGKAFISKTIKSSYITVKVVDPVINTNTSTEYGNKTLSATHNGGTLVEGQTITNYTTTLTTPSRSKTVKTYASGKITTNYGAWQYSAQNVSGTLGSYSTAVGTRNVTVTYNGLSAQMSVTWAEKNMTKIEVQYVGTPLVEGSTVPKDKIQIKVYFDYGNVANSTSEIIYANTVNSKYKVSLTNDSVWCGYNTSHNTVQVGVTYEGRSSITLSGSCSVAGYHRALESISAQVIDSGNIKASSTGLNEVTSISSSVIQITCKYTNGTSQAFTLNNPDAISETWMSAGNNQRKTTNPKAYVKNSTSSLIYGTDRSTSTNDSSFITAEWRSLPTNNPDNPRLMELNVSVTYTGESYSNGAIVSNEQTKSCKTYLKVYKKTPVSMKAEYHNSKENDTNTVMVGTEFDPADVDCVVSYDNGSKIVLSGGLTSYNPKKDLTGVIISGYSNGYEMHMYSHERLADDESDNIDLDYADGMIDDYRVYYIGDNEWLISFAENGKTVYATFVISAYESPIVSIEAEYVGPKVTKGLTYSPANVIITAHYENGTVGYLKGYSNNVTLINEAGKSGDAGLTVSKIGKNTYTAKVQSCQDTFEVEGIKAVLTSIYPLRLPDTIFYNEGDDFDPKGMIIMATFSDYTEGQLLDGQYEILDGTNLKAGQNYVTISYTLDDITCTTKVEIFVEAGQLEALEVTGDLKTKIYDPGDTFDPAGLIVKAVYSSGAKRTLSETDYKIIGGDPLKDGQTNVTLSYTEKDVTVTAVVDIKVRPRQLDHIEVSREPNKTAYYPGENFDSTGLSITAVYTDGSVAVVTDQCIIENGTNLKLGQTSVSFRYTENGRIRTTSTPITVSDANLNSMTALYLGDAVQKGSAFDSSLVEITLLYTDGKTEIISGNKEGVTYSTMIITSTNQQITVNYRGLSCTMRVPMAVSGDNQPHETLDALYSYADWKEFFTIKETRSVEDYYYVDEYKIGYIRKGTESPDAMDFDVQVKAIGGGMDEWSSWYHSDEILSIGGKEFTQMKVGLIGNSSIELNAVINGVTYNNLTTATTLKNPTTVRFSLSGKTDKKIQYRVFSDKYASTKWYDEGTTAGYNGSVITGIEFRFVKK